MVGMHVTVATTASSFNGTFTIATVPTSTTFTYLQAGVNATSGNGVVQLVIQGDVYTDAVLTPLVQSAYTEAQFRLQQAGSKSLIKTDTLTLAAGDTEFTDTSDPALFSDFLAPRKLYQKIAGSTNKYFDMGEPCNEIPDIPASTYVQYWTWQQDGLYFSEATADLDIKIRYTESLPRISDADSQLLLRGIGESVGYYGAFIAAQSRGNPQALALNGLAEQKFTQFLNMQAHARQYQPARRAPYGGSGRGSGSWNF